MRENAACQADRALTETELLRHLEGLWIDKMSDEELRIAQEKIGNLPKDTVHGSYELCYRMVQMKYQLGELKAAHKWQAQLVSLRAKYASHSSHAAILENRIACAGILLTSDASATLILNMSSLAHEFGKSDIPLARLSATGRTPSVLRGAKDLSFLSPFYNASVTIIRPLVGTLLEDGGDGVCDVGVAEVLYQRGDNRAAAAQAEGAVSVANPEIALSALAVLAWVGAADAAASKPPEELLAQSARMLEEKGADYLKPVQAALEARFAILRGDRKQVRAWLEGCGVDELADCAPRHFYELITKAKAYISLGEYRLALTLLERLVIAFGGYSRPLDVIECLVAQAATCALLGGGDLALQRLERALLMAQEYGFVRIIADGGKQVCHLLTRHAKDLQKKLEEPYLRRVTEASRLYAALWPSLYEEKTTEEAQGTKQAELTASEFQVLELLDKGFVNKQIAAELHMQVSKVKSHVSNLLKKLGATNRAEALANARSKGIFASSDEG